MQKKNLATDRRHFLKAAFATSAVFGAENALAESKTREAGENGGRAKNVIFMVSDGMNHGALSLARQFLESDGKAQSHWMRLYRERPVVRSLVETFSANSCVTDSAAAASAWGGGQRVNNGTLNFLPDGSKAVTLHQKLKKTGRKTGLVTTATITHATPAGFAVNMESRGDEATIAAQYLERGVDVLLGGGRKFFSADLKKEYAAADYDVAESKKAFAALSGESDKPLLGIFNDGHLPYSIDLQNVPEIEAAIPTLAEMTEKALARLAPSPDGFFLLVEGARIDHAGHANDAAASIHDQIAFDDAIGTALTFIESHPDTLLVITTDHGCGGIQMNGVSGKKGQPIGPGIYNASNHSFDQLRGFKRSLEWMKQNGVSGLSGPPLGEALAKHTGLTLTEDEIKAAQGLKSSMEDIYQKYTGVGWTSGNHTGELVEFCALGPGSRRFPAFLRNCDEHALILEALDLG
ncbi:MAG: alkaline phosphatase [Verrucomicrobiaceae bacterium]|nr:alkaline phosphatase [Verrucomicrobiaceae bacterium]